MSRSSTRARKRSRAANARRSNVAFLDQMRAAEFSATGKHSSLGLLAASHMAQQRAAVADRFAGMPVPETLPHTVHDRPTPSAMPQQRTIWQAATGEPTPAPVPVIPDGARPTTEPTPVKAGELPAQARELAKIAKDKGLLSREWLSLGAVERDGRDAEVYARLHGNSVRYSIAD